VIINVPNKDLKLKPGMTANVNIEVAAREDVVRIPNAALRFRPTAAMFAALGQTAPPSEQKGRAKGDPATGADTAEAAGPARTTDRSAISVSSAVDDPAANRASAKATTIDALFSPLVQPETDGRVWIYENNELKAIPVRLGITDGQTTELVQGDVTPGTAVVTNITTGSEPTRSASTAAPAGAIFGGGFGGPPGGGNRGGAGAAGGNRR
jgi:HlyD family secretion protein